MEGGKENWLMKRKPLFARRSCVPDINPLRPTNALSVESQHDKAPYNLRSRVGCMKDVERQNSLSCEKVKDYYFSSVLQERDQGNHHGNSHSIGPRLLQKEKFSDNSYESDYTFKELPVQQKAPATTGKSSASKLSYTLGRPAMLRKQIDIGEMRIMLAKLRKNQPSVFNPKEFGQNNKSCSRSTAKDSPRLGFSRRTRNQNLVTNYPGNQNLGINSTSKEYFVEEVPSDSDCNPGSFQECRRALCFDKFQESQDEDQTAPLEMMDITARLPNELGRQDSPTKQKKYQFQGGLRRDKTDGTDNPFIHDKTNVRKGYDSYFRNAKSNIPHKDEHKPSFSSKKAIPKIIVSQPEVTALKTPAGKANVVKRRSVIPLPKSIPKYKVKDKLSYSTSKLTRFSENKRSQIKSAKKTQKVGRQSNIKKSMQSLILDVPKVEVAPPEPVVIEEKPKPVEFCHASTNTGIMFSFGKSPNKGLVREVGVLMEEQEEITRKAQMILDETLERRRKMKSGNLLESFKTSVSPLKRLCGMIQDKTSFLDISSVSESVKATEAGIFTCASREKNSFCLENSNMDISVDTSLQNESLGCSILNNTGDFNSRPMKWKQHLNLNSRIIQHPPPANLQTEEQKMSPVTDEEQFVEREKDISPFTEMAGCCERPSLAPMTPHSHHQVSILKLSLRKQLNQLYES